MKLMPASSVVAILSGFAAETGNPRLHISPTTLRCWFARGHIKRNRDGYDMNSIITYLQGRGDLPRTDTTPAA